jgi:ribosomal protein S18 acetylase RimI-like enzyme
MEDLVEDTITIREISLEDADSIYDIRRAISEDDGEVNFTKVIEQQLAEGSGRSCLVALINGEVVGYMMSTSLYAGFGMKKSAWIMAIGVHPEFMGQGIGLKLADRICAIYKEKGIKNVYSSVRWDSTDVLSFFKKLGFQRSEFINLKKKL